MRYILFGGGEIYYAAGGANDFMDSSDSLNALTSRPIDPYMIQWWHIFDTVDRVIVAGTKTQAYGAPDFIDPKTLTTTGD